MKEHKEKSIMVFTKIWNVSWTLNQHLRKISEGSCDTEDWSNDAENSALQQKNYRIHLTSGKCVSHKHYSLHPFRLSERGRSETYTKRVKYHFLFKDYLLHTTSENAQQSPSFQSLHKISWKEFQKVKKGTNWLLLFTFFHKYGSICNQHFKHTPWVITETKVLNWASYKCLSNQWGVLRGELVVNL